MQLTLFSVSELRRDGELNLLSGASADEAALPAFDDSTLAEHELEWLIEVHIGVEDLGQNSMELFGLSRCHIGYKLAILTNLKVQNCDNILLMFMVS